METLNTPPTGDNVRAMVRERVAEATASNTEKLTIEWRGQPRHFDVIAMPVDLLYYNPDTHRIRAQRSLDTYKDAQLTSDPWGQKGQSYLAELLKSQPANPDKRDPDFDSLMEDLENFGQKDPGLITATGVLVNGNTRCAALRELGERYIRVAVLPESTTWSDVNEIELSLQLRKEFKRDYSYINRLIAVDEQLKSGARPEDIARSFRTSSKVLEGDRWIYGVILDAIERSKSNEGAALRLVDFEDHQEKLRELYRTYTKLGASDMDAAEALKEARITMIVLGYAKTDVRLVGPEFFEKYLEPKLPPGLLTDAPEAKPIGIPGLAGVSVPASTRLVQKSRELTDKLLKAKASMDGLSRGITLATAAEAEGTVAQVADAIDRALKPAGQDTRLQKRKMAAPERLSDACDDIGLCVSDLVSARAAGALDPDAFEEAVVRLQETLGLLGKQAFKSFEQPGPATEWLIGLIEDTW